MESLSDDILMEILSRVCTLDLASARRVCKRWKTMLEEPLWHKLHCSNSILNPNNKILMVQRGTHLGFVDFTDVSRAFRAKQRGVVRFMQSLLKKFRLTNQGKVRVCGRRLPSSFKIFGSCNGLLCLLDEISQRVYIKNPFTDEGMNQLPKLPPRKKIMLCGLAYNPTTNIYKVMAIVYQHKFPVSAEVMVCECGSMMNWRTVFVESPYHLLLYRCYYRQQAIVNGRLHWLYTDLKIASFDFNDEELRTIRSPESLMPHIRDRHCYIIAFQNCLCLVQIFQHRDFIQLQVWIMKKYGIEDSWVNEFDTESAGLRLKIPLKYRSNKIWMQVGGEVGNSKILIYCYDCTRKSMFLLLYEPMNNHKYTFFESGDLPLYWDSAALIHNPTLSPIPGIL